MNKIVLCTFLSVFHLFVRTSYQSVTSNAPNSILSVISSVFVYFFLDEIGLVYLHHTVITEERPRS